MKLKIGVEGNLIDMERNKMISNVSDQVTTEIAAMNTNMDIEIASNNNGDLEITERTAEKLTSRGSL